MEFSSAANNLKNSCLSLSRKKAIDSPKTPKQNLKRKGTSHFENACTPESYKLHNNIFEESPTQSYYDHCTLSQNMIIDDERDVIWNWDKKHASISNSTCKTQLLKESGTKNKLNLNNRLLQEKKKVKLNNFSEGLHKLQALQQVKKSTNFEIAKYSDSVLSNSDQKQNNSCESNSRTSNFINNRPIILNSNENIDPSTGDSGFENNFKRLNNNITYKNVFDDEDDILYQHSQIVEKNDQKDAKENCTEIENEDLNNVAVPSIMKNSQLNEEVPKGNVELRIDKASSHLDCEDSFDDIFLSIDLSYINDNKKLQFQRHNSMPLSRSNKETSKSLIRHGSANNFYKGNALHRLKTAVSPISDVTDASIESSDDIEVYKEIPLNNQPKRCSKEEVEAKRLEAKRKRLLRMNKISPNNYYK